jgi:hypothetical protein
LSKALIKRAMQAELTEQIGYEKSESGEKPNGNRRNGKSSYILIIFIKINDRCNNLAIKRVFDKHTYLVYNICVNVGGILWQKKL